VGTGDVLVEHVDRGVVRRGPRRREPAAHVAAEDPGAAVLDRLDVGLRAELEPLEPGEQRLAGGGVGVEEERVGGLPDVAHQRADLAGRFEQEAQPVGEGGEVLAQLALQVGLGVGSGDPHERPVDDDGLHRRRR